MVQLYKVQAAHSSRSQDWLLKDQVNHFTGMVVETEQTQANARHYCEKTGVEYFRFNPSATYGLGDIDVADTSRVEDIHQATEAYLGESNTQIKLDELV